MVPTEAVPIQADRRRQLAVAACRAGRRDGVEMEVTLTGSITLGCVVGMAGSLSSPLELC